VYDSATRLGKRTLINSDRLDQTAKTSQRDKLYCVFSSLIWFLCRRVLSQSSKFFPSGLITPCLSGLHTYHLFMSAKTIVICQCILLKYSC